MKKLISIYLFLFWSFIYAQNKLDIKFQPPDYIYAYETKGLGTPGDIYSAVVQNIAVINPLEMDLNIESVEILAFQNNTELQKHFLPKDVLLHSAKLFNLYQQQGILQLYDFQFQTSKYLQGITFSDSTSLGRNEALVISHRPMLFQELPTSISVIVHAKDNLGNTITGQNSIDVLNYQSENQYHLPLKGTWYVGGAPSLISHHRWSSIQEFAFDFTKIGENGITYKGDGSKLSDYYAYAQPIYSIGSGKVISVKDGLPESEDNLKRPDETQEAYSQRMVMNQQALLVKGFSNILGNYIIIEHSDGEYSFYVHLKNASIVVKEGDNVERGQKIATLGNSGNSTEPHLHFHMADGPDLYQSRSIPVYFDNIKFYPDDSGNLKHMHYGQIIITDD